VRRGTISIRATVGEDVLAAAQRLLTHHTSKRHPINVSQLEQLIKGEGHSKNRVFFPIANKKFTVS